MVSDNRRLIAFIRQLVARLDLGTQVDIRCSPRAAEEVKAMPGVRVIDLKREAGEAARAYPLVISAHCKQLFPAELHQAVECVNIHPGLNPQTRGWFPHVWALVKGLPAGVTVHRIDELLDHGDIIERIEVAVHEWDTSRTLYDRILDAEEAWLAGGGLERLMRGDYECRPMASEGSVHSKADFDRLCRIDLDEHGTFGSFYDRLRALTFEGYRNAFIEDPQTGKRIFLELKVTREE